MAATWVPWSVAAQRASRGSDAGRAGAPLERAAAALAAGEATLASLEPRVSATAAFAGRPPEAAPVIVVLLRVERGATPAPVTAWAAVGNDTGAVQRFARPERDALVLGGVIELHRVGVAPGAHLVRATVDVGGAIATRTLLVAADPGRGPPHVEVVMRGGDVELRSSPAGRAAADRAVASTAAGAALFELAAGRPAAALARLRAMGADSGSSSLPGRVLRAEALARLGLDGQLERAAASLLSDPAAAALAAPLRLRLALAAYARGDDAAAAAHAATGSGGGSAVLAGLAQARAGALGAARVAFARARREGGAAGAYAAYADAVARLRADSTQAPAALDSLVALAAQADAGVAGRAGVTAAQLAYQLRRYAQSAALAGAVRTPAVSADAALVRAWALYKDGAMTAAAAAFDAHARLAPARASRGEAELLAAQALLIAGRTAEAGSRFRGAADSAAAAAAALERGGSALAAAAAVSGVRAGLAAALYRSADALLAAVGEPALFDDATLAAVVRGEAPRPAAALAFGPPRSAAAGDLEDPTHARLWLTPPEPARAVALRDELARAERRSGIARAAHAIARAAAEREEAAAAATARAAAAVRREIADQRRDVGVVGRQLAEAGGALGDPALRDARRRTAVSPAADSLAGALSRARAALAAADARVSESERAAAAGGGATPALRAARAAVTAAEREEAQAGAALVAVVTRELDARRRGALAALRRDAEAAELGAASASFIASGGGEVPRPVQVVRPRRAAAAASGRAP